VHDAPLYPVSLVVRHRPCLVVGGGPVAVRKVDGLLACGADVTVVAPDIVPAIADRSGRGGGSGESGAGTLSIRNRPYRRGEAAQYWLVVSATGIPAVDRAVAEDAEAAGVWVNSADDAANCSFLLPAVHRDGPVTVAVSTGGASPALASWIRTRVGAAVGPDLGALATVLDDARTTLRARGGSTESVDWRSVLDGPFPELVRSGHLEEARAILCAAMLRALPPSPPR